MSRKRRFPEGLRPGPATVEELFDWPARLIADLLNHPADGCDEGARRCQTLLGHLHRGIAASSDFSGWDSQAEALRLAVAALYKNMPRDGNSRGIAWLRSCDSALLPRRLLCNMAAREDTGACVFGHLEDRLGEEVKAMVASLLPPAGASKEACIAAHAAIAVVLRDNAQIAFAVDGASWCFRHQRRCPAYLCGALHMAQVECAEIEGSSMLAKASLECNTKTWWRMPRAIAKMTSRDDGNAAQRAYLGRIMDGISERTNGEDLCEGSDSDSDHEAQGNPLVLTWGSTVCHGYTQLGKQLREADPGEVSHNIWVQERSQLCKLGLEDLYFHENSVRYPVQARQAFALSDTHIVKSIDIGGLALGLPYDRVRRLTAGWSKRFRLGRCGRPCSGIPHVVRSCCGRDWRLVLDSAARGCDG